MICRRTILASFACLAALTLAGCGAQDVDSSAASLDGYLGSYSLDLDSSVVASLPVWQAAVTKGVDKEISNLVASPPAMIKKMRDDERKLSEQGESIVRRQLKLMAVDLTLSKRLVFELATKIPELSEDGCSGLWTVKDGELFLVRDTINGVAQEEQSSLRLSIDGADLALKWPGLSFVFVLRKA